MKGARATDLLERIARCFTQDVVDVGLDLDDHQDRQQRVQPRDEPGAREHLRVREPFLLVAMIAAVRRITAEFGTLMDQGERALSGDRGAGACLVGLRKRDKTAVAERA